MGLCGARRAVEAYQRPQGAIHVADAKVPIVDADGRAIGLLAIADLRAPAHPSRGPASSSRPPARNPSQAASERRIRESSFSWLLAEASIEVTPPSSHISDSHWRG